MEVGLHGAQGRVEDGRDLLITAAFLIMQREDGTIARSQPLEAALHCLLHLTVFEDFRGAGRGVGQVVGLLVQGRPSSCVLPPAEFVVHDVDDDAIQKCRDLRLSAKMRQGAKQPQEDFLRQVLDAVAIPGEASEGAEDHGLVPLDQIFEIVQAGETVLGGNCFMFRPGLNEAGETKFCEAGLTGRKGKQMRPEVGLIFLLGVAVLIPIAGMATGVMMQWFKTRERLRLIEKGLPLPPDPQHRHVDDPWEDAANFRVGGLITIAVGVGLLVLFPALAATVPAFPKGVTAVAAIPILVGAALYHEYRVRIRELGPRPKPPA
jgi:hypothetical protein